MFACSWSATRVGSAGGSLRKELERSPTLSKLRPPCPIFLSEQREQREQRFKIKHLHGEQRSNQSEHHEQRFKINDLRSHGSLGHIVKPRYALKIKSEHYEHEQTRSNSVNVVA